MRRTRVAVLVLCATLTTAILTGYKTLYCVWMSAHPLYDAPIWHTRYLCWGCATLLAVALSIVIALWASLAKRK